LKIQILVIYRQCVDIEEVNIGVKYGANDTLGRNFGYIYENRFYIQYFGIQRIQGLFQFFCLREYTVKLLILSVVSEKRWVLEKS